MVGLPPDLLWGSVESRNSMRLSLKSFTGVANRKSLHFGPTARRGRRDDKGEDRASIRDQMLVERTADPSASVGMTKGRTAREELG
jgi:hypothetical protein